MTHIEYGEKPNIQGDYLLSNDGKKLLLCLSFEPKTEIPECIQRIDSCAFRGCKNLCIVDFSSTVREIGIFAFDNCYELKEIEIPSTVGVVGGQDFSFSGLEKVKIDKEKTKVLYHAFLSCRIE